MQRCPKNGPTFIIQVPQSALREDVLVHETVSAATRLESFNVSYVVKLLCYPFLLPLGLLVNNQKRREKARAHAILMNRSAESMSGFILWGCHLCACCFGYRQELAEGQSLPVGV